MIALATITFSCKTYEDSPGLTLLSVEQRLAGVWTQNSSTVMNEEGTVMLDFNKMELKNTESGNFQPIYALEPEEEYVGNWNLSDDKEYVYMDLGAYYPRFKILALTKTEVTLQIEPKAGSSMEGWTGIANFTID